MWDYLPISIFLTLFICFVTTFLFWLLRKGKGCNILILGRCDSGKTTLFFNLIHNSPSSTFTSITENVSVLIDIPGHEKLREEIIRKYLKETKALLFLVDSNTIQNEIKDVAEKYVKILIVCNKQDLFSAKGVNVITHLLEKELNTLTLTRVGALDSLDHPSTKPKSNTLTKPGSTFSFAKSSLPIEFVECSATKDPISVRKWLNQI